MAKLYFYYASMNAGKSTTLLQADFNYRERGMRTMLFTAAIDDRFAAGTITSRIGLAAAATPFDARHRSRRAGRRRACRRAARLRAGRRGAVPDRARRSISSRMLADAVGIPVLAYGLRTDFQGALFEGSARLLALADALVEIKSVCALRAQGDDEPARRRAAASPSRQGAQTEIGGNDRYVALCRRHFTQALAGARCTAGSSSTSRSGSARPRACRAVKRALREGGYGKVKVGHGGTLDPLATGVLPIALGEATKLAGRMLDSDKVYDFTIRFGAETDTLDLEGEVIATSDVRPTLAQVEAVLPRFTGPIEQVPPAYSALKVDGERAYDLARAGEEVVLATRDVTIHSLSPPRTGGDQRSWWRGSPSVSPGLPLHQLRDGPSPCRGGLTKSPSPPTSPRAPTSAASRATSRIALGTVGHVTMLRRTQGRSVRPRSRRFRWTNWTNAAKARALEDLLLPLRAGLDDIPALPSPPTRQGAPPGAGPGRDRRRRRPNTSRCWTIRPSR